MLTKCSALLFFFLFLSSSSFGRHPEDDPRAGNEDSEYTRSGDIDEDIEEDQRDDDETDFEEAGPGDDDSDNLNRGHRDGYQESLETINRPRFDPDQFDTEEENFNKYESKGFSTLPHGKRSDMSDQSSQTVNSNVNIQDKNSDVICVTPECVTAAATLIQKMNASVDPCDDFYEYACGGFPDVQEMFEDMPRVMSFELLRRKNSYDLKRILNKLDTNQKSKAISNVKVLYDSCMNLAIMDKRGIKPILNKIKEFGDWPLVNKNWNADTWDFKKTLNNVNADSFTFAFFSLSVGLDAKDAEHYIFTISQSGIYLPKEYYASNKGHEIKAVDAYGKMMKNVVRLLGFSGPKVVDSMKSVFNLEKKLARIYISSTKARANVEKMYKKTTFKYLAKSYPEIDWKSLLERYLDKVKAKAKDSQPVVIIGEEYLKRLVELIKQTDKETLANYLFWRIASVLANFGPQKMKDEMFKFHKAYSGTKTKAPRWKTCLEMTQGWLKFAIGRLYVDNKFNSNSKDQVYKMIHEIRRQFINNLKDVEWMDKDTKDKAKEKAEAVLPLVGYPTWLLDDTKLDKFYDGLNLKNDDYLGNYLKLNRHDFIKSIKRVINGKRDRKRWTTAPSIVNAFYSQLYNRIVFPAGILQKIFYDKGYPLSLNFGGIGTVIGHELTHGFDDLGRKYDKNGNMHHWWKKSSIKGFEKRADCIRKQYSSYKIYGSHMNGNLSCGENIADNGGIKMAYFAFKKQYLTLNKDSKKKLPGLQHLSHDQLFFLAFGNIWCVQESKTKTLKDIFTDMHSYPKFRVHGTISNSAAFAKAYNCPLGSRMNPKKKCIIW